MEGIYTLQSKKEITINLEKKTINYSKRGETKYYERDVKILYKVLDKEFENKEIFTSKQYTILVLDLYREVVFFS